MIFWRFQIDFSWMWHFFLQYLSIGMKLIESKSNPEDFHWSIFLHTFMIYFLWNKKLSLKIFASFFEKLLSGMSKFEARFSHCFETGNNWIKAGAKKLRESNLFTKDYTLNNHDHCLNVLYLLFFRNEGPCQFLL